MGGAGFGIPRVFDEVQPGAHLWGPGDMLIFAPRSFIGAGIPCSNRMAVTGKSLRNGAVGRRIYRRDEMLQGDAILAEGKPETPVCVGSAGKPDDGIHGG